MLSFSVFTCQGKKPPEWLISQNNMIHKDMAFGLQMQTKC